MVAVDDVDYEESAMQIDWTNRWALDDERRDSAAAGPDDDIEMFRVWDPTRNNADVRTCPLTRSSPQQLSLLLVEEDVIQLWSRPNWPTRKYLSQCDRMVDCFHEHGDTRRRLRKVMQLGAGCQPCYAGLIAGSESHRQLRNPAIACAMLPVPPTKNLRRLRLF